MALRPKLWKGFCPQTPPGPTDGPPAAAAVIACAIIMRLRLAADAGCPAGFLCDGGAGGSTLPLPREAAAEHYRLPPLVMPRAVRRRL